MQEIPFSKDKRFKVTQFVINWNYKGNSAKLNVFLSTQIYSIKFKQTETTLIKLKFNRNRNKKIEPLLWIKQICLNIKFIKIKVKNIFREFMPQIQQPTEKKYRHTKAEINTDWFSTICFQSIWGLFCIIYSILLSHIIDTISKFNQIKPLSTFISRSNTEKRKILLTPTVFLVYIFLLYYYYVFFHDTNLYRFDQQVTSKNQYLKNIKTHFNSRAISSNFPK